MQTRTAPTLSMLGCLACVLLSAPVVAHINHVLVSPSGGNYTDPIIAANNAFTGDPWCNLGVAQQHPCVIHIAEGLYGLSTTLHIPARVSLVGEEQHRVLLVGGEKVVPAVTSQGPLISDLSIDGELDFGRTL